MSNEEKVAFVSNHDGTSRWEISALISICPLSVLCRFSFASWLFYHRKPHFFEELMLDCTCLILPSLLAYTVFSNATDSLLTFLFFTSFGILYFTASLNKIHFPRVGEKFTILRLLHTPITGRNSFITNIRAYANISMAITILAVDFSVFPRRYCKTETFGTGFMDIGVGGYVLCNAIVSPEARGKFAAYGFKRRLALTLRQTLVGTAPLWLLGLARVVSLAAVNYHQHTSEYGLHWNFFFTLAVVKILATLIYSVIPINISFHFAALLVCVYEYLLEGPYQLREYLLFGSDGQGTREGFLNANREGVFSCLGYLSLYMFGVVIGRFIAEFRQTFEQWLKCFYILVVFDFMLWALLHSIEQSGLDPVSRRLANMAYVGWTLSWFIQLLACFLLVDLVKIICFEAGIMLRDRENIARRCLLEATNYNALMYFLASNLLTGWVNLSVNTLTVAALQAVAILCMYMGVLSLGAVLLFTYNIQIKYW